MSSPSESNRTVHLSNLPFQGNTADHQKYKTIIADAFKAYDFENAHITDKTRDGKTVLLAHVTFKSQEGAQKALKARVIEIQGKQVIIEKYISQKDYQLYIKEIGTLTENQLQDFFGNNRVKHVHTYKKENQSASAIISFENPKDAEEYITKPQQSINGIPIRIERFIPKENREDNKQLYLMRIPIVDKKIPDLQKQLNKQFSKFGQLIKEIEIEWKEGSKIGSAFISYENPKSLEQAREGFNLRLFGDEPMKLEHYLTKKEREQRELKDSTIFINNILGDVDILAFVDLFKQFGKIEAQSFNKSPSRNDLQIQRGTITFSTNEQMNEALADWPKVPNIYSFFVGKKPQINIFQDKTERNDFLKTIKPNKPQQQPQPFNNAMRPPPYMMGMPPMGPMGMPGMGMPPMGLGMPGMPMQGMPFPGMMPPNPLIGGNIPPKVNK